MSSILLVTMSDLYSHLRRSYKARDLSFIFQSRELQNPSRNNLPLINIRTIPCPQYVKTRHTSFHLHNLSKHVTHHSMSTICQHTSRIIPCSQSFKTRHASFYVHNLSKHITQILFSNGLC